MRLNLIISWTWCQDTGNTWSTREGRYWISNTCSSLFFVFFLVLHVWQPRNVCVCKLADVNTKDESVHLEWMNPLPRCGCSVKTLCFTICFLLFVYLSIYLGNINLIFIYLFIYIFFMYIYTVKYSSRNMSNTHEPGDKGERSIGVKGQ